MELLLIDRILTGVKMCIRDSTTSPIVRNILDDKNVLFEAAVVRDIASKRVHYSIIFLV